MEKAIKILINLNQTVAATVETYELALGLLNANAEVSLILSEHAENIKEWEKVSGRFRKICYIDTHTSRKNLIQKTVKFVLSGRKKVRNFFRGEHFDYLINTMGNYWDPLLPALVDANEIVTYIHDPIAHSGTPLYIKILRNFRYKQANQIVVHTKSFIPIVIDKYGFPKEAVHYVPHGRLGSYKDCWIKEKQDPIYIGKTNFVFFGTISKYKGLHVLAKAYEIVCEQEKNVTLTIAGKGDFSEYEEEYEKLPNVIIKNYRIKDEEIGNIFSIENSVAVLPYLDATQSGVIITAMEFGTPIIATNVGGLKEQLDDGQIGLLCEAGNKEDLAQKMLYIIHNTNERKKQEKLMRSYLHTLDRDVIAKQLLACITAGAKND